MELRQLKYFKEACELQNFSEAARVLHISQSTLSQQIKTARKMSWMCCCSTASASELYPQRPGWLFCLMLSGQYVMRKTENRLFAT